MDICTRRPLPSTPSSVAWADIVKNFKIFQKERYFKNKKMADFTMHVISVTTSAPGHPPETKTGALVEINSMGTMTVSQGQEILAILRMDRNGDPGTPIALPNTHYSVSPSDLWHPTGSVVIVFGSQAQSLSFQQRANTHVMGNALANLESPDSGDGGGSADEAGACGGLAVAPDDSIHSVAEAFGILGAPMVVQGDVAVAAEEAEEPPVQDEQQQAQEDPDQQVREDEDQQVQEDEDQQVQVDQDQELQIQDPQAQLQLDLEYFRRAAEQFPLRGEEPLLRLAQIVRDAVERHRAWEVPQLGPGRQEPLNPSDGDDVEEEEDRDDRNAKRPRHD